MTQEFPMLEKEHTTEKEWLEDIFYRSNSHSSQKNAIVAMRTFDIFCKEKLELPDPDMKKMEKDFREKHNIKEQNHQMQNIPEWTAIVRSAWATVYEQARKEIVQQYRAWYQAGDVQSICTSIQKWIRFCSKAHTDVRVGANMTWKAKSPQTVRNYLSTLKDYLRNCEGVRVTSEDIKDYIRIAKAMKQQPEPIALETLKQIISYADPTRRALYYVLLTSGMRLGEGLSLKKSNFKTDVRPIQVHLHAKNTKTLEARDTFITEEAWERVQPIFEATKDGEYLFHNHSQENIYRAVIIEDKYFGRLREKIAKKNGDKASCDELPEGTGILKRYEDSVRYCVQIHAFRSWFMTKAMMKHGTDYAHGLAGHHTYLDQYIRIPNKNKNKMYLELEKDLLLESSRVHSEQFHEAEITEMQGKILKLEAKAERNEELEVFKEEFDGVGATS